MKYKKILLGGGSGFISSSLLDYATKNNIEVRVMDIKSGGDVRNEALVKQAIDEFKPDLIINMASTAGIDKVEKEPIQCIETNVVGAINFLKHKGNTKYVHFSTSEVYGEQADRNLETDTLHVGSPHSPRWSYQASKLCAEHLVMNADKEALIIRPFNVFGPKQIGHGAIADFIDWAKVGHDIKIYGDGHQLRSWCIVDDFLDGMLALINNNCKGIYNIGNPDYPQTIEETANEIIKECGSTSKLYYVPKREVDVWYRVPNIDRITKDTNWKPKRNFHDSLKETIKNR